MIIWLMVLGFWALMILYSWNSMFLFGLVWTLCILWVQKDKRIVAIWFCFMALGFILTFPNERKPTTGMYSVIEIKNNYVLARKEDQTIVVYGLENPNYFDQIEISQLEPLHSLHNKNLFHFPSAMHKQGIDYGSQVNQNTKHIPSHSLRARCYFYLKNNKLYSQLFYQQGQQEDEIVQLGLPILGVFSMLRKRVRKSFSIRNAYLIEWGCMIIYMFLFPIPHSLLRMFLFSLASYGMKTSTRRLQFSICAFLCLKPYAADSFAFVLPVCLQAISLLNKNRFHQWLLRKITLILCQLWYFHRIDFFLLVFFGPLRKLYTYLMSISLIPFARHLAFHAYSLLTYFLSLCPKVQYHYTPGFLFLFVLFLFIWKRKNWLIILLCLLPIINTKIDPFFHVYMLDIGQGDCTLIVEPFSRSAVMIDCGGSLYRDNVDQVVFPFLQSIQISHLDALIVTHDDFDHNGAVDNLSKRIPIESIITNPKQTPSVSYPFFSLLPDRNEQGNDASILSYFVYDDIGYLWTGDAGARIEQQLIQSYSLDVDILKLGHHGSDTSSSFSFLDTLRPKLGLVSVGYKNRYRHPSSQVIARCHQLGIQTLETQDVGAVHLFSFRGYLFFESASGLFGIIRL